MKIEDIKKRYRSAIELVKECGDMAKEGFYSSDSGVEIKDGRELVTKYDKLIEKYLKKKLLNNFPEDIFMGEEFDNDYSILDSGKAIWIVDPIDGTNNFAHKIPIFAISIGLYFNNKAVLGVIFNPITNELFRAMDGEKAYLNDVEILASKNNNIKNSIVATGFPYNRTTMEDSNIYELSRVLLQATGIRRMGAASIDICYVASGKMDGYWESNLKPWDVAAGIAIATASGCKISNFTGDDYKIGSVDFVVSNSKIHNDLLNCLQIRKDND